MKKANSNIQFTKTRFFSLRKRISFCMIILLAVIYSLPMFWGDDFAVELVPTSSFTTNTPALSVVEEFLQQNGLKIKSIISSGYGDTLDAREKLIITAYSNEDQKKIAKMLKSEYKTSITVSLALNPAYPKWLSDIGAKSLRLGLDLRGGIHFVYKLETKKFIQDLFFQEAVSLRSKIKSVDDKSVVKINSGQMYVKLNNIDNIDSIIFRNNQFAFEFLNDEEAYRIEFKKDYINNQILNATNKAIEILQLRIDELGISDVSLQRQGIEKISLDLPGMQDIAYAKRLLGKTSNIRFHLEYQGNNADKDALKMLDEYGREIYLQRYPILTGDSIIEAIVGMDELGKPDIGLKIGGKKVANFKKKTAENVGKKLAVVYSEQDVTNLGKIVTNEKVLIFPVINQALSDRFVINGVDRKLASDIAMMLRTGSFPTPLVVIEEAVIGPNLGEQNIQQGKFSVIVGSVLVFIFMVVYYREWGLIANLCLICNLFCVISLLSLVNATLTLPGIAGIVLTIGMAVDANVLIFERIKEEMREGNDLQKSFTNGFERALSAIIDSNITTLLVGVILFGLGFGVIKGFAVTLIVGLITSLFTSLWGSKFFAVLFYKDLRD